MTKVVTAAVAWLVPTAVSACTVCDSDSGVEVRAGILDENFWSTLLAIISPFPVLLIAIAAVHRQLSRRQP